MKLVRARPKLPEHLPDWAKCCAGLMNALAATGEITVDLDSAHSVPVVLCKWCLHRCPPVTQVKDVKSGEYVEIELLDLDETGVPNGNYVESVIP